MLFAVPASTINSLLEYLNKMMAMNFKRRLTHHFHDRYVRGMIYYQITNLDNRIANPDQRLTEDLSKWSEALASLYTNFTKPLLDLVLFSRKLSETMGIEGPLLTMGFYFCATVILRFISPPMGNLTANEQNLEGEFRSAHANLLSHSEEVAFYNGGEWEKTKMGGVFDKLYWHVMNMINKRFYIGMFHYILVKYGAVMGGYATLGLPVFGPGRDEYIKRVGTDVVKITEDYMKNASLLINLA